MTLGELPGQKTQAAHKGSPPASASPTLPVGKEKAPTPKNPTPVTCEPLTLGGTCTTKPQRGAGEFG